MCCTLFCHSIALEHYVYRCYICLYCQLCLELKGDCLMGSAPLSLSQKQIKQGLAINYLIELRAQVGVMDLKQKIANTRRRPQSTTNNQYNATKPAG
ncbi:jg21983 [Pararge aegeria aegeria]|uniref:Jg21983 protein n=1 Tax=Pararge aegeria aegeria TaxID=348720 RepID=A0A8S4QW57_9NEOP|nr:jg21983 [Pararge aegeria aegeria]